MRTLLLTSLEVLGAACATTPPAAGPAPAAAARPVVKPGLATVGDTSTCPVSGETFVVAVDSPRAEYQGKTYYFCCKDCVGDFLKDPAHYVAKVQ